MAGKGEGQDSDKAKVFAIGLRHTNELDDATLAALRPYANITGFLAMAQCFFYLSVQKLNATVINVEYSEKVLQEWATAQNYPESPMHTTNDTNYYFQNASEYEDDYYEQAIPVPPILYSILVDAASPQFSKTFVIPWSTYLMFASQLTENGFLNGTAKDDKIGTEFISMLYQGQKVTTSMHAFAAYMTTPLVLFFHGQFQKAPPQFDLNLDVLNTEKVVKKVV
ncbi:hypothetical protein EYC80_010562 [Monilinia laxa]|uniref:Uncharacterized protein n=1 Tax=Monilinia laxa TaxID=61186 RepID=A0A5N6JPB3_MONLA|nr:hypothetical protein EYC80_010562 [Monilinia laxa]